MDKDQYDKLTADIRLTLQAMHDNLLELNDYLARLRAQTVADINAALRTESEVTQEEIDRAILRRHSLTQAPADMFVATTDEPTPDPRRPYQNQRQPRRDGDSFGSVLPLKGGTDGTKTEGE